MLRKYYVFSFIYESIFLRYMYDDFKGKILDSCNWPIDKPCKWKDWASASAHYFCG